MKKTLIFLLVAFISFGCGSEPEYGTPDPTVPKLFNGVEGVELINLDLFETFVSRGVPAEPLKKALLYLQENDQYVKNKDYMTLVDFSKHSSKARFYILDLVNQTHEELHVAHGKGTDPGHTGYAKYFSNVHNSKKSSLGIYLTAERYWGSNGLSMRLDGKEASNSNARSRYIVVHGAKYVSPGRSIQGRSWGCPAVAMNKINSVVEQTENGSILYAFK